MVKTNRIYKCPLCGCEKFKFLGDLAYDERQSYSGLKIKVHFTPGLYKCENCCSCFVSPRLSKEFSRNLYFDSPATKWIHVSDINEYDLEILFKKYSPVGFKNIFEKYFTQKKGKKILDVGCFQGKLLDIFKTYSYETYGVDLNNAAISKISSRHNAICGEIGDAKKFNVKFDVIIAFDLVEHLYDIEQFWKDASSLLKDNGMLVVLTGSPESIGARIFKNKWWYFKNPEHIIFPSKKYYKSLKAEYGLCVEKVFTLHHRIAYIRPIVYRIKMYGLLSVLLLKKLIFGKSFSKFGILALSVPELSPDHSLIIMKKIV